jgi:CYTH domain-containing protein
MSEKTSESTNQKQFCRTELRRVFLLSELPEPLTRASDHLQFFDNYLENTRLRLRTIRSPLTKEWSWILEQRFAPEAGDLSRWLISEIHLNEAEHAVFAPFEGREIQQNERVESSELRFNRYFYDFSGRQIEIDVFLNPLWGLNLAKVYFEAEEDLKNFTPPDFVVAEVTHNSFFTGSNLVGKTLEDVKREISATISSHA